jgi:hypothetical protein
MKEVIKKEENELLEVPSLTFKANEELMKRMEMQKVKVEDNQ